MSEISATRTETSWGLEVLFYNKIAGFIYLSQAIIEYYIEELKLLC